MRFTDVKAIVTGGAAGIGKATARRLSDEGALVAVIDMDGKGASAVAAAIGGIAIAVDISDVEAVPQAMDDVVATLGTVDLLVNCAGWDMAQPFTNTDPSFWMKVIGINLLGAIAITHAALPHMADGSAVVNVSSDAGRVGSSGEVVYSAAKGGVIGFTKALARETASRRIRVNCVAPGPTDTAFLASFDETGKLAEAMTRQTPLKKLATPADVAAAICFLGSSDASHITGQILSVSGGLTMV
ncbi:MAG: SDR family oxidoreductase [Acidimicrobiia bacterium]